MAVYCHALTKTNKEHNAAMSVCGVHGLWVKNAKEWGMVSLGNMAIVT